MSYKLSYEKCERLRKIRKGDLRLSAHITLSDDVVVRIDRMRKGLLGLVTDNSYNQSRSIL